MSRPVRVPHELPAGEASPSPAGALSAAHPRLRAAARLGYVAVVLFATLPGTGWSFDPRLVAARLARALHPSLTPTDVLDAIRNVLLFSGLGVVWIATTRTRRLWPPVWRATAAGALLSLLVEGTQLTSPVRFASALDVATNAAGAFLGALAAAVVVRATRWELERGTGEVPLFLIAASHLGATVLEAFSPWGRPDRVPGAWGGAGRRFGASLAWTAEHVAAPPSLSDVFLFVPAGAVVAAALVAYGASPHRAALRATGLAALAYALAELARGFGGGDMRPAVLATRVVAAAAGAVLVAVAAVRGATWRRRSVAIACATAVLVCWYWRPFGLRTGLAPVLEPDHFVPLRALLAVFSLYSVADVAVDFLLFFPLGVWLAVRPMRTRGPLGGMLPALWLATVLEFGQLWVAERTFDVTDLLVEWAGVLVGWEVVRQARLRVVRRNEGRKGIGGTPPPGSQRLGAIALPASFD